ncbi:MAG: type II toxin-antitoxin system VapC family toxin [Bryobacteraceae bacterium]|jgi:predicted nucleic acid-binding protein
MKAYLDSSAVLGWLLQQPGSVSDWSRWEAGVSSELLLVEVARTLDRMQVLGELSDADIAEKHEALRKLLAKCTLVELRRKVLARAAGSFHTAVGTLDAVHLATALLWVEERDEPLVFLTHDKRLSLAARAHGLEVEGV